MHTPAITPVGLNDWLDVDETSSTALVTPTYILLPISSITVHTSSFLISGEPVSLRAEFDHSTHTIYLKYFVTLFSTILVHPIKWQRISKSWKKSYFKHKRADTLFSLEEEPLWEIAALSKTTRRTRPIFLPLLFHPLQDYDSLRQLTAYLAKVFKANIAIPRDYFHLSIKVNDLLLWRTDGFPLSSVNQSSLPYFWWTLLSRMSAVVRAGESDWPSAE